MGRLIVLIQLASLARTKRAIADITKANSSSSQIDLYLAYYESYFFYGFEKIPRLVASSNDSLMSPPLVLRCSTL